MLSSTLAKMSQLAVLPRVVVLTNMPSHYQVDLFNRVHELGQIDLHVVYLRRMSYGRYWAVPENMYHPHTFIREIRLRGHLYLNPGAYACVRGLHPDLLIVCQYASPATQVTMWLESLRGQPWVFWSESPGIQYLEAPIVANESLRRILRWLAMAPVRRWSTAIWGIGHRATECFRGLVDNGIPCANMPYFSDLSSFSIIERSDTPTRPIHFLFSGSLIKRKGFDLLVNAIKLLAAETDDFELVIIGRGPQNRLLVDLPPETQAHVKHLGFVQRPELPPVYGSCDVLVFPSRYDGWGMVVPEAMAAGMPVIASSRAGVTGDVVRDGENGRVVNPEDTAALAEALYMFVDSPALIREWGSQARQDVMMLDSSRGAVRFIELSHTALDRAA